MAYFDLIREICDKENLNAWVYDDGDNPGKEVLQIYSDKEIQVLNSALIKKFKEKGIDTSEMSAWQEMQVYGYIDFATDENWVYSDESFICDGCGKLFRMEAYGYANYFCGDSFILCPECMKEEPETYLETLINNYHNANTLLTKEELEKLGFEQIGEEYENGWYGQSDDPKEILDRILSEEPNAEVIFDITKTYNPFATRFTTYIRKSED